MTNIVVFVQRHILSHIGLLQTPKCLHLNSCAEPTPQTQDNQDMSDNNWTDTAQCSALQWQILT